MGPSVQRQAIDRHPDWPGLYADGSPDIFNGLTPLKSQMDFLADGTKYFMWGGEVRAGKTVALCWKLFSLAWSWPNNLIVLGRWHKEHLYESTLDTFRRCYPETKYPITYEGGKEPDHIKFPNGSKIMLVPLSDRKRWPGQELGAFGIDQAEQCTRETWTDLSRRLCRMTVPVQSHFGLGVSNFEANWDWARDMFVDKSSIEPDVRDQFGYMTNPHGENDHNIPPNYRNEQGGMLSPMERDRLILGIDHRNIGHVYPAWNEERHVRSFDLQTHVPLARYYVSYDYGREHPTAILLGAVDADGRHWIRAEQYANHTDIPDHEIAVHRLALETGFPLDKALFVAGWDVFAKKHDGRCIADEWSREFVWTPAPRRVHDRIERVSFLLRDQPDGKPGLVVHPDCVNLRHEMARYKYKDDGSGEVARETEHYRSDAADSLGYFALKAIEPSVPAKAKSSLLTPQSFEKMLAYQRRTGRRMGYWEPTREQPEPIWKRDDPESRR